MMTRNFLFSALLCAFLLAANKADAQQFPRLHDVTGVDAGDTLSIRENPRASAKKLGEIPHDTIGIEVVEVSENGDWGRINAGETSGWASLRYLSPHVGVPDAYLAQPLHCFGTEPFWSLQSDGKGAVQFSHQNQGESLISLIARVGELQYGMELADLGSDSDSATIALSGGLCSDGMSNALYGISVGVLYRDAEGPVSLNGCCSLKLP